MTEKFVKELQELCRKYKVNIVDVEGAIRKEDSPFFHELVIDEDCIYYKEFEKKED